MFEEHTIALPVGYRFENFRLESVLGHGGFGITYRALDEDLQQVVAIKEYLPREVAFRGQDSTVFPLSEADRETFEWGLERFLDEARTLARFQHPNIVGIRRFLRANGTAYLVMDYCEGESLESLLAREGTLPPERLEVMLLPLFDALEALHAAGVTHRDIKPGNIYLREDGSPVLLDFGAARQALAQHSRSVTAMATAGYAAFEQYSTKGKQGPWTDIYGLGATLYRCVTGQRPPDASDRMLEDELVPAVEAASSRYPQKFLQQIDAALKLRPQDRPQTIAALRRLGLGSMAPQPKGEDAAATLGVEPKPSESSPAAEPAGTTGGSRGWVWLLIVGALIGYFIWGMNWEPNPQHTATVTRDSPAPRSAPPRSQGAGASVPGGLIEDRYQILGAQGEIVRDTVSGLEWQRCTLGQTWNGRTCVGEAEDFTWAEARQAADGMAGWRLPAIAELRSLVYCSSGQPAHFSDAQPCQGDFQKPTIVEWAFPRTVPFSYWAGSIHVEFYVYFDSGTSFQRLPGQVLGRVRLVRGILMENETAELEVDMGPEVDSRKLEIERLLNAIEEDLAADRLTFPPGGNAFERVQAILDLSPGDERALEGRRNIMERYEELTRAALARTDFDRVESLLQRMDEVQPGSSLASGLRDELSLAREVQRREQALLAEVQRREQALLAEAQQREQALLAEAQQREQTRAVSALIAGRYRVSGDSGEVVMDTVNGLEWQRCSLGQTWAEGTCVADARGYTWEQARQAADRVPGWRLPTIEELRTLVYCSSGQPARFSNGQLCQGDHRGPTIFPEAFPNTPGSDFWSGSSYAYNSSLAWGVSFYYGSAYGYNRSHEYRVRLVHGGE